MSKARQIARRSARATANREREHHATVIAEQRRVQAVVDAARQLPPQVQREVAAKLERRAGAARLIAAGRREVHEIVDKYGKCGTRRLLTLLTAAERERVTTIAQCEAEIVGLAERLLAEAEACVAPSAGAPATAEQT